MHGGEERARSQLRVRHIFGSIRNFVDFFEVHVGGGDKERG